MAFIGIELLPKYIDILKEEKKYFQIKEAIEKDLSIAWSSKYTSIQHLSEFSTDLKEWKSSISSNPQLIKFGCQLLNNNFYPSSILEEGKIDVLYHVYIITSKTCNENLSSHLTLENTTNILSDLLQITKEKILCQFHFLFPDFKLISK